MLNNNVAETVNAYMLANAPTVVEANPIIYELLKVLARQLIYKVGTTSDHVALTLFRKYGNIYAQSAIAALIQEAMYDESDERLAVSRMRKAHKRSTLAPQLLPFS